jgi:hypothetical protein
MYNIVLPNTHYILLKYSLNSEQKYKNISIDKTKRIDDDNTEITINCSESEFTKIITEIITEFKLYLDKFEITY